MVRLALFDLDNTLVDRQHALPEAVAGLCADLGLGSDVEMWMGTELADRATLKDFARMRCAFGLAVPAAKLWTMYVDRMAVAVSCRSDILEGLANLRAAGWTIGVISNGASDIQRAKLTMTRLAALVDGVAISDDIQVRKPDSRLFHLAATRCGAELTPDVWMTGDDPVNDVGGGAQAGLRTIWLRGRTWPTGLRQPDHTVDDVVDAMTILLGR